MRTPRPWAPPQTPTRSRDLRALGISSRKLSDEVARGVLVQLRRGVYVAASQVPDDQRHRHLLHALAEQRVEPLLVATGPTAALAWHLPFWGDQAAADAPPVLAAPKGGSKRSRVTSSARIRLAELPPHHVVAAPDGLRVTTRARTAVDVSAGPTPWLLATLDAALRAECQEIPSVRRRSDLATPRIHEAGRSALAEAAAIVRPRNSELATLIGLADPRRETVIESLSAGHIHLVGLPQPVPQAPIATAMGTLYPDFLWPAHRLIGEADGRVKYRAADVMMREKEREQLLRDLGFAIVRGTGKEIHLAPGRVMDRIARALSAHA